ncbi:MAG: response regulator [Desulfobacterales bacterium]|nr:response regulator [Desulfobacterales bacterium]
MNKKFRILLVDDEETFVMNLARIFAVRGFETKTAFSGFKAIEIIQAEQDFDVVLLDNQMPGMDGVETLRHIKNLAPDTEVIMLTGYASLESGVQAVREGAFDYLMKPCDIEDLTEKVQAACELEHIRRHPILWPRKKAGEIILFAFLPLKSEDPLTSALDLFNRYTGKKSADTLFITDRLDRLQGLVTKSDLITAARENHPLQKITWDSLTHHPQWLPEKCIGDIMCRKTITTGSDATLREVADRMITHKFRSMPVVSNEGAVIGIIRMRDVLEFIEYEVE